ncbi:MAG: hypothetical protein WAT66_08930 [Actinomycetota bacterium]
MNHPLELNDLTLLVRALHRDVSELDARLRAVEDVVRELQDRLLADVPALDLRLEALPGA